MTRWTADVFINSKVGRITTEVEAATYEGARQQLFAKHGQIEQVYGLDQVSEGAYASPNSLSKHEVETQRQLSRISDELEYHNELQEGFLLEQARDEWIEAWKELWESINEDREEQGEDPLSFGEMVLMHGNPFEENSRGMDARPRANGLVNIDCVNCDELISIPDMQAGLIQCPTCDEVFHADSTIPFNYERYGEKFNQSHKENGSLFSDLLFWGLLWGIPCLFIWFFSPIVAIVCWVGIVAWFLFQ